MRRVFWFIGLTLAIVIFSMFQSCSKGEMVAMASGSGDSSSTPMQIDSMTETMECDTSMVTYSTTIVPLITEYCLQCHSGDEPRGGVELDNYTGVKKVAEDGSLYGSLSWQSGYETMPQGADQLPGCILQSVKIWIDGGSQNN